MHSLAFDNAITYFSIKLLYVVTIYCLNTLLKSGFLTYKSLFLFYKKAITA